MNRTEVETVLDLFGDAYGGRWRDRIDAWHGALETMPADAVMSAARTWIAANHQWAPSPGQLRAMATPPRSTRIDAATCSICCGSGWRDVQEEHNGKLVWVCVPCECLIGQTRGRAAPRVADVVGLSDPNPKPPATCVVSWDEAAKRPSGCWARPRADLDG